MKLTRALYLIALSAFLSYPAIAEEGIGGLNIFITQAGSTAVAKKLTNSRVRVSLSKKTFEFHYSAKQIGMCVSINPDVFEKAKIGTNIQSDYSSCMFMFKAFGMSADGGKLIVDIGGSNWLNKAHGAKKGKDGRNFYRVASFTGKETGKLEITKVTQPMYLAIWEDLDNNQIIDTGELVKVELAFK